MFTNRSEINNYPFAESATLLLNDTGYTLPKDLLLDACAYPRCGNTAPFHVASINKWSWTVIDSLGAAAFTIVFPETAPASNYYAGYCIDQVGYCGSVLGTSDLYRWIRAVPGFSGLPEDSLEFSAGVVRPVGVKQRRGALVVASEGVAMPVTSISWGDHITITEEGAGTVVAENPIIDEATDTPITTVIVNSARNSSRQVSLAPMVGSKVRVIAGSDIRVGKVSEL